MVFPTINLSVLVLCLVFHFSFSSPVVNPGSCLGSRAMADIVSVDSNAEGSRLPYFSLLRSYQRNVPPPILLVWRYALSTLGLCLKGRRSFLLPLRRLYSAHEWFGSSAPTTFMPRLTLWICHGHMFERIKTSPVRTIWARGIHAVHTPTLSPTPVLG